MSELDSSNMKTRNVCEEDYSQVHNSKLKIRNNSSTDAAEERNVRPIPVIKVTSEMESLSQSDNSNTQVGQYEKVADTELFVVDNVSDVTGKEQTEEVISNDKNENSRIISLDKEFKDRAEEYAETQAVSESFNGERVLSENISEGQTDGVTLSGVVSANVEMNSPVEIYSAQQKEILHDNKVEDDVEEGIKSGCVQLVEKMGEKHGENVTKSVNFENETVRTNSASFATGHYDRSDNKDISVKETLSERENFISKQKDEKISHKKRQEIKYSDGEDIYLADRGEEILSPLNSKSVDHNGNLCSINHLGEEKGLCDGNKSDKGLKKTKKYKESTIFPQLTMPSPLTETVGFIEEEGVIRIFQDLASQIVYERPSNPFEFMVKRLEDMKLEEEQNTSKKRRRKSRTSIPKR